MNRDSAQAQTLLKVFEALGVPLMSAVDELMVWQGAAGDAPPSPEEAARRFATLLSAAIAAGNHLSDKIGPTTQEESEATRLKTSTIASTLIAQHYVLSGQFPDDAFNHRMGDAFDALLNLVDTFGSDNTEDVDAITNRLEALTPFVQATMRFSFGLDDNELIQRLGEELCERATELTSAFSKGLPHNSDLFTIRENAFLKGCASLMARACEVEMDHVQQAITQNKIDKAPDPDALLDSIWGRFENGLDVLRGVLGFMTDPYAATTSTSGYTPPPPTKDEPKSEPDKPKGDPGNPMSFFAKPSDNKKTGTGS